jgi:hypothetical protein
MSALCGASTKPALASSGACIPHLWKWFTVTCKVVRQKKPCPKHVPGKYQLFPRNGQLMTFHIFPQDGVELLMEILYQSSRGSKRVLTRIKVKLHYCLEHHPHEYLCPSSRRKPVRLWTVLASISLQNNLGLSLLLTYLLILFLFTTKYLRFILMGNKKYRLFF